MTENIQERFFDVEGVLKLPENLGPENDEVEREYDVKMVAVTRNCAVNKAPVENLIFSELEIYPGYTSTGVGKYLGLRYQKPTGSVKMKKNGTMGGGCKQTCNGQNFKQKGVFAHLSVYFKP